MFLLESKFISDVTIIFFSRIQIHLTWSQFFFSQIQNHFWCDHNFFGVESKFISDMTTISFSRIQNPFWHDHNFWFGGGVFPPALACLKQIVLKIPQDVSAFPTQKTLI